MRFILMYVGNTQIHKNYHLLGNKLTDVPQLKARSNAAPSLFSIVAGVAALLC
jgi:hypothetical protein